ncbi:hypothetical protein GN244_ATG08283 [Phytophthora infestans]|uniref:Uncharacterized protein n=1 Tax=Phytophthora infestans TaxID=4787 RepID=A0A833SSA1_PHYIN|nr:hypothetical protein GN244_ATG08283 [Phytophthora infestans]KAF4130559.1 hypothetical protein GN958_ATG20261 [Phytophthora infestans]
MDGLRDVELLELPCNTPIVMMTIAGDTLTAQSVFVELIGSSDGFVTIQNANNKWQRLAHDELGSCQFAHPSEAVNFKPKMAPSGGLVFESEYGVLGIYWENRLKVLRCRGRYWQDTQAWVLLQQYQLGASDAKSTAQLNLNESAVNENDLAGRVQLVMQSVEFGKTLEELKEILELVYGTEPPMGSHIMTSVMLRERRKLILKLLEAGLSTEEAGGVFKLVYRTSPSIMKADAYSEAGTHGSEYVAVPLATAEKLTK